MEYFTIKNWHEFQHYKDRNPPWIKLHNALTSDYEFNSLTDAQKWHLIGIWLLASRVTKPGDDPVLRADESYLTRATGSKTPVKLKPLFSKGFLLCSKTLATCYPEAYTEERRGETEKRESGRFTPPSLKEVKAYCQERGNNVDPGRFVDFYSAKGWMVGKNKMKDWRAAVRNWERGDNEKAKTETRAIYHEEAEIPEGERNFDIPNDIREQIRKIGGEQ